MCLLHLKVMYKLYQYKNLNCGFIVLCPNCNLGQLKSTINSIGSYYKETNAVIIMPNDCKKDAINESSKLATTYTSNNNLAAMINTGMSNACSEWNFIILAKGWLRSRLDIKYSYFIESQKDILFPIIGRKLNFFESELHLILIHKKSFKDIGQFPIANLFETSKLMWTGKALEKGYRFKGVVGGKAF